MRHLWWEYNWTSILDSFNYTPVSVTTAQIIVQGVPGGAPYANWRLTITPVSSFSGSMSAMTMPEGLVSTIELRDPAGVLFLTVREVGLSLSDIRIFGITSRADSFVGTSGDDAFAGGHEIDHLQGFDGADRLWGDDGDDPVEGGNGADYLEGGLGDDRLEGGAGNDEIWGGRSGTPFYGGNNVLLGGDGDDLLRGGSGNDILDGGSGHDTARFSGSARDYDIITRGGETLVSGVDGKDVLIDVEVIVFDDGIFDPGMIVCFTGWDEQAGAKASIADVPVVLPSDPTSAGKDHPGAPLDLWLL